MKKIICISSFIFLFNIILNAKQSENWIIKQSEQSDIPSTSFINIASDSKSILVLMFTEDSIYATIFWGDEKYSKEPHSISYSLDNAPAVNINGQDLAGYSLLYLDSRTEKKDGSQFIDMLLKSKRLNASLTSSKNENVSTYFELSGLNEAIEVMSETNTTNTANPTL